MSQKYKLWYIYKCLQWFFLHEALRLLEERDEMYQARLAELRHAIELGREGAPMPFDAKRIKEQARRIRSEKAQ